MGRIFKIRFENGHYARVANVAPSDDAQAVRAWLRLNYADHALLIHAGADGSTPQLVETLKPIFVEKLAPLLSAHHIPVIDGGTQSGTVGLMGLARRDANGTFPLVGVTPYAGALYPGGPTDGQRSPLDPNHTHFVLVQGGSWGTESNILVNLGKAAARQPVALFINGGEIVRKEALMQAKAGNPLLVLAGSGRVADEIVDARKRGTSNNILKQTLTIGRVLVCTPDTLVESLMQLFDVTPTPDAVKEAQS